MGDNLVAFRVADGLQSFLLQVDIAQIIMHEGDEPNTLVHFLAATQHLPHCGTSARLMTARGPTAGLAFT